MSKNILIFSDGTGQYGGIRPDQRLSNIYKMYRAMRPGTQTGISPAEQVAYYDPGLGSGELGGRLRNILASAFGTGISENIVDCYEAIIKNYEDGDRVFIFGFSRGAYTARCIANVMNLCGVPRSGENGNPLPAGGIALRKIAEEAVYKVYEHGSGHSRAEYETEREELARRFREKYGSRGTGYSGEAQGNVAPAFVGVFDTVAALGTVIVRRILGLLFVVSLALVASAWGFDWAEPWKLLAHVPAGFFLISLLWASKKQFKYIRNPPQGGRLSWHFAAWNLKNYDRFLDSSVGYARHALSIDENRKRFPRVGWGLRKDTDEQDRGDLAWLKQVWFAGNHSDIGGSYPENESRLSDISLQWMLDELRSIPNPPLIDDRFVRTFPDALGLQHDEVKASRELWPRWWPRWARFGWKEESRSIHPEAVLHDTVLTRLHAPSVGQYDTMAPYRPIGLQRHHQASKFFI
ncbi:DUF2235 domain-containing protein [Novosphingobium sp. PP1Y]|uniref:DUF2235 domain-containing protein n=1 Tax=Novosphingobium sp. PP1Y TaxID=702113 RepID=UPI00020EF2E5|nr:DUF2235 domain-containing protein [Novosphingobium sp. PP1Y]CCA93983.1 conserved hypothetical protein [Novosphingobium sp. PP1Y]